MAEAGQATPESRPVNTVVNGSTEKARDLEVKEPKKRGATVSDEEREKAVSLLEKLLLLSKKRAETKAELQKSTDKGGRGQLLSEWVQLGRQVDEEIIKDANTIVPGLTDDIVEIVRKFNQAAKTDEGKPITSIDELKPLDYTVEKIGTDKAQSDPDPIEKLRGAIIKNEVEEKENSYEANKELLETGRKPLGGGQETTPQNPPHEMRNEVEEQVKEEQKQAFSRTLAAAKGLKRENFSTDQEFANAQTKILNEGFAEQARIGREAAERLQRTLSPMELEQLGMSSRFPDIKKGVAPFRDWIRHRLEELEEEYPDLSFDANWRLIYPVEQAIQSLADQPEYDQLRKDLTAELQARRARHNNTYVFRQVSGTTELIGAGNLLDTKHIQTLLRLKTEIQTEEGTKVISVADTFREMEKFGKAYQVAQAKKEAAANDLRHAEDDFKHKRITQERLDHFKKEDKQADESVRLAGNALLAIQERNWAGRIAGGLFSALGESARHDTSINKSGDFFWNRVPNFVARARGNLRDRFPVNEKLDLETQDKIVATFAPAVDLRIKPFWQVALESARRRAGSDENFRKLLDENHIKGVNRIGEDKWDYKDLDLSEAKFEDLNLGRSPDGITTTSPANTYFELRDDELKIYMLDIDDANNVRKIFWDPTGFLHVPSFNTAVRAADVMKHLKGNDMYDFYKGVGQAVIDFYKDSSLGGWVIPKPRALQNSLGKITMDQTPWGMEESSDKIKILANRHLIDRKREDELLTHYFGPALTRGLIINWWEKLGIFFGALYKGVQAMNKATK